MENVQELVEKWELSGLLEGVVNKEGLAHLLEGVAFTAVLHGATLNFKLVSQKHLATALSLTLPAVRRVLGEKNFEYLSALTHKEFTREVVEVEYPENEELEPELCATIADRLSKKLEAYPNLKVHGVIPEFINEDQGKFQIHFLCS